MRCGVLCDRNGFVKRAWSLVSDTITIPVEDGDRIMEWDVDSGEALPHTEEKQVTIAAAVKEQECIHALHTEQDVVAHCARRGHQSTTRIISLAHAVSTPIYYSGARKGLCCRTIDKEGITQETQAEPVHTLQLERPGKPHRAA